MYFNWKEVLHILIEIFCTAIKTLIFNRNDKEKKIWFFYKVLKRDEG